MFIKIVQGLIGKFRNDLPSVNQYIQYIVLPIVSNCCCYCKYWILMRNISCLMFMTAVILDCQRKRKK